MTDGGDLPPGFVFVDELPAGPSREGHRTALIRSGITSLQELFASLGTQLDFPDWWGRNWNALLDILRSDEWWDDPLPIVILHEAVPLVGTGAGIAPVYLDVIAAAQAHRSLCPPDAQLRIVFLERDRRPVEELSGGWWSRRRADRRRPHELRRVGTTPVRRAARRFTYVERLPGESSPGSRTARIPSGVASPDALFDSVSAQLDFPDWWGRDWKALLDILGTDKWWDQPLPIVLVHEDIPLAGTRTGSARAYLSVLARALARSAEQPDARRAPLRIVFLQSDRRRIEGLLGSVWSRQRADR